MNKVRIHVRLTFNCILKKKAKSCRMSLNVFFIVRVVISKYRGGSISVFATLVNRFVPVALGEFKLLCPLWSV